MHSAYHLKNHSLREHYFGSSNKPPRRYREHAAGRTQAISHWDWDADHISCCTVSRHRSRAAAHAASKRMERSYAPRQGWQVICT